MYIFYVSLKNVLKVFANEISKDLPQQDRVILNIYFSHLT